MSPLMCLLQIHTAAVSSPRLFEDAYTLLYFPSADVKWDDEARSCKCRRLKSVMSIGCCILLSWMLSHHRYEQDMRFLSKRSLLSFRGLALWWTVVWSAKGHCPDGRSKYRQAYVFSKIYNDCVPFTNLWFCLTIKSASIPIRIWNGPLSYFHDLYFMLLTAVLREMSVWCRLTWMCIYFNRLWKLGMFKD